jgi:hypothetical protein
MTWLVAHTFFENFLFSKCKISRDTDLSHEAPVSQIDSITWNPIQEVALHPSHGVTWIRTWWEPWDVPRHCHASEWYVGHAHTSSWTKAHTKKLQILFYYNRQCQASFHWTTWLECWVHSSVGTFWGWWQLVVLTPTSEGWGSVFEMSSGNWWHIRTCPFFCVALFFLSRTYHGKIQRIRSTGNIRRFALFVRGSKLESNVTSIYITFVITLTFRLKPMNFYFRVILESLSLKQRTNERNLF